MSSGVLLHDDWSLCIHGDEITDNLTAEIIVACEADTLDEESPECGFQHRGQGFYHLTPGHDFDDVL